MRSLNVRVGERVLGESKGAQTRIMSCSRHDSPHQYIIPKFESFLDLVGQTTRRDPGCCEVVKY